MRTLGLPRRGLACDARWRCGGTEGRGRRESAGDTICRAQYRGKTRQPLSKTTKTIKAATAVLHQVRGLGTCVGHTCEAHGGLRSSIPSLEAEGAAQRPLMGPLIQGGGGETERWKERGGEIHLWLNWGGWVRKCHFRWAGLNGRNTGVLGRDAMVQEFSHAAGRKCRPTIYLQILFGCCEYI